MNRETRTVSVADGVGDQPWTRAFTAKDAEMFTAAIDENVVLEASALRRPVEGRDRVKQVMEATSGIYESLVFVYEVSDGQRSCTEREAEAFGGKSLRGSTILTVNEHGKIVRAAIQHLPLDNLLAFSAELGKRLNGKIDSGHVYTGG
ncbi:nuclear transport factor 2 family protein [Streptomyces sp. TBY4]|uniref:nuclear transport factor 2 family protein n=1 Tax=Streptomyces sp. TBY4 TaxID=2962030 RepID=UPI0020B7D07C|nr:nuclear transport factor 2 family protein [Streptomyces sp. TBY4]MCP3759700.1 nuclear transport factor 2 family protein [Streptomyces sp. TBY4]